jgi:hypothetical protein
MLSAAPRPAKRADKIHTLCISARGKFQSG